MKSRPLCRSLLAACALTLASGPATAELPPDTMMVIETLPVPYPEDWVFVMDGSFFHFGEGKMILLDPTAETLPKQYKGMLNGSMIAPLLEAKRRSEIYVADIHMSRWPNGTRSDTLTVYDKKTLAPIATIDLPPKRLMAMPIKWQMQLIGHERFLLITNHTPATSVTVVDIARRSVVGEIELPGCMLTYPTGDRGFTTLCGDGKMITYQLDASGAQTNMVASEAFNDVAGDPMFEEAQIIDGIGYFPTFKGQLQEIDFRGDIAKLGKKWSLIADNPPAEGWRPGGLQLTGQDNEGRLYVLMHPEGGEGTHKDGGSEVWVYDVKARKRIMRMPLKHWAVTIEVTQGGNPLLLSTNIDMNIDVYNISNGDHLRTLSNFGAETPFMMHAVNTGRPR